jgi:hypothetical protein
MNLPEYISKAEVRNVCKALGISDWSKKKKATVSIEEARKILRKLDVSGMKIDPEHFRVGLEVELEHGTMFPQYNVTNNHPLLTGKIVLAHFMEMLDYYRRLEVAELEGDLLKALVKKDIGKARKYFKRIARAKEELAEDEGKRL